MKIVEDVYVDELEDRTWDCDDFWNVVREQDLGVALNDYLESMYSDGASLEEVNDLLRHDGESVLRSLGADLTDTIWDEDKED